MEFTYFIHAPEANAIKIGKTTDIKRRLSDLQSVCPVNLELRGYFLNTGEYEEKTLHKRFKTSRKLGEWFVADKAIFDFLFERRRDNVLLEGTDAILERERQTKARERCKTRVCVRGVSKAQRTAIEAFKARGRAIEELNLRRLKAA